MTVGSDDGGGSFFSLRSFLRPVTTLARYDGTVRSAVRSLHVHVGDFVPPAQAPHKQTLGNKRWGTFSAPGTCA